jgi:hypothetical protein
LHAFQCSAQAAPLSPRGNGASIGCSLIAVTAPAPGRDTGLGRNEALMRFLNDDAAVSRRWIPGASLTVFANRGGRQWLRRGVQNRIDVHHHFYPREYLALMGDAAKRLVVRDWTVAGSLEEMDKNGMARRSCRCRHRVFIISASSRCDGWRARSASTPRRYGRHTRRATDTSPRCRCSTLAGRSPRLLTPSKSLGRMAFN